jgi:hypothetical protein
MNKSYLDIYLNISCESTLNGKKFQFILSNNIWRYSQEFFKKSMEFERNILYYIEFKKDSNQLIFSRTDTIKSLISDNQIKDIYFLVKRIFIISNEIQERNSMIFTGPYDGLIARLELTIPSGTYTVVINVAENNKAFVRLVSYLIKLKDNQTR